MKNTLLRYLLLSSLMGLLTSCVTYLPVQQQEDPIFESTPAESSQTETIYDQETSTETDRSLFGLRKKKTPPQIPTKKAYPFGIPVPGKNGIVYSPYDKTKYVDVRGLDPGTLVECPYTKEIFRVP